MTKRDLVERLKVRFPELEEEDLKFIVENFFEILTDTLKGSGVVELRGFGSFKLKKTKSHFFINPKTGQKYYLSDKLRPVFRMSKELKERLNTPMVAGLDLGTQSFRLILGKLYQEDIIFLQSFRENVRLGEGVSYTGLISDSAEKRALASLNYFKALLDKYEVSRAKIVATAIFRKAQNAHGFLEKAEELLGYSIKVLSPEEEAELTLKGTLYGLKKLGFKAQKFLLVDVGGGSTEFIYFIEGQLRFMKSLDLGVVFLKDFFNLRYPLTSGALKSLENYIEARLKELPDETFEAIVITGGSASLLGSLDLKLTTFSSERLHGHRVSKDRIEKLIRTLSYYTLLQLKKIRGMEEGREDIALPGLIVYKEILSKFNQKEVLISEYGILEGTLLALKEEVIS